MGNFKEAEQVNTDCFLFKLNTYAIVEMLYFDVDHLDVFAHRERENQVRLCVFELACALLHPQQQGTIGLGALLEAGAIDRVL